MARILKLILTASIGALQPVIADVQVNTFDRESGESSIKISKTWAKIADQATPGQYMLIDMTKGTVYMVDGESRMVIVLDDIGEAADNIPPVQTAPKPKIEIKKAGKGPKVAGYKTTRYQLKANGRICSEHLISTGPLKHAEINAFSEQMKKQSEFSDGMDTGASPCELAEREFDKRALDYGVPLMSADNRGQEVFRITEIKTGIKIPRKEFAFPQGYEKVTQSELIQQQMQQSFSRGNSQMMDMESGKMPTEEEMEAMQEQLKQLQEMMQNRGNQ